MTVAPTPLRLGTRGSVLAMAQTERVIRRLAAVAPGLASEPVVIRTEGDVDKSSPLTVIGGRGVFTSALQDALRRGEIDAAVHSAKDLPSEEPAGLALVAFPEREDARDVLISRHGRPLADLPPAPTIGTSSRRRAVQVRHQRPDARIVELRGNVDTRLRKALEGDLDGIVLAAAGIRRMGLHDRITEALPLAVFVPSPGQGALAVEARIADEAVVALLTAIDDPAVARAVRAERAFLRAAGGGCTMPIGAYVAPDGGGLRLLAMLADDAGERVAWADERLDPDRAETQVAEVARWLVARVRGPRSGRWAGTGDGRRETGDGSRSSPPVSVAAGVTEDGGEKRSLAGLRVLVTRARAQAAPLAAALREQGAEPVELPTLRIEDPADPAPLDAALHRLAEGRYDWVVFTSVNGVERVLARLDRLGIERVVLAGAAVVAVGAATAATLRAAGIKVDLVPARSQAEEVVAALAAPSAIAGRRVLYPRGDLARQALADGLRAGGAQVDAFDAYRTVPEPAVAPEVRARLARGEIDVVTFASPSSVRNLVALVGGTEALAAMEVICVGPVTAAAARAAGLPVHGIAADASVAGIVAALVACRTPGAGGAPGNEGTTELVAAGLAGGEQSGRGWR